MSNNKQQTAVEWYAIEMAEYLRSIYGDGIINLDILKQAKEMEKEQIMKAISAGCRDGIFYANEEQLIYKSPEQYYNETYGDDKK
jgi:hypothetical protein